MISNFRLWLSAKRWASVLCLALVGAVAFEIFLSGGWHFIKSSPDPLQWFSPWFLRVAAYLVFLVVFYVAAEPFRIRIGHYRYWLLYPPLWSSILLAVVLAAIGEHYLPAMRTRVMPEWRQWDIAPLALAVVVALLFRQLPWQKPKRRPDNHTATIPPTWESLKTWLQREEPIDDGPDLLSHAPIVQRIYEAVARRSNAAVALIGSVGSGKTSILNGVKLKLTKPGAPRTIVAEFNCWAMPRPEDAPRLALERAIDALERVIDVQAIRRLPRSYQRILAAEPTGKISRILGLDDNIDDIEQLAKLTPLLEVLDARLLIVIEDGERAGRSFETQHLERLLWSLRRVERVSFVLSFDPSGAQFDYSKLCDSIERVPAISASRVEDILAPAYTRWLNDSGIIDPHVEDSRNDRLGLANVADPMMRYVRRRDGETPTEAITALLTSPRDLKHFIREVDGAWSRLRGEVELDDLIVMTVLRNGAPEAFEFIVKNIDLARLEVKDGDRLESDAAKNLKTHWEELRNRLPHSKAIQTLVEVLGLPRISDRSSSATPSPQGIRHDEPADYLDRILSATMSPTEIRDQDVLKDISDWKAARAGGMMATLEAATTKNGSYVAVWEKFADDWQRFEPEELIEIATILMRDLLKRDGANASMSHPAMLAIWRRCNRRVEPDSHNEWLIDRTTEILPTSLAFATDIFYYWASVNHGIVREGGRATVRQALVASARATLTSVEILLNSLGALDTYSITRLMFPPPAHQPPDPVPFTAWEWLVNLVIPASKVAEERVVPDVAVLVIDSMEGFRKGDFVERYILMRDRVKEIFGARTKEMLEIFAAYKGDHKHAVGAKNEAIKWLREVSEEPPEKES